MKNKFLLGFASALAIILAVGCSSLLDNNQGIFGKAQQQNQKVGAEIRSTENAQAQSNEDKLKHIGAWSQGGVQYSLDQIKTNIPQEVTVAKQMNARVEALAGKPDFKEVEAIKGIVDDLLSQVQQTRIDGEKALAAKDKQIADIQANDQKLDKQREDQIAAAMEQANQNAQVADQYKATLQDMDKWGGLGAVWYGLHKFVIRMAWILGIGGGLFLLLRILASSNPIAGAIFSIFDQMGSWLIHTIAVIFPKALSIAGNVSTSIYNNTKSALNSIVDSVETVKLQEAASGKPATIEDLLNTAELSMTPEDKALIEKIKLQLGWVRTTTAPAIAVPAPTPVATPTAVGISAGNVVNQPTTPPTTTA